jgi:hypothetical protein
MRIASKYTDALLRELPAYMNFISLVVPAETGGIPFVFDDRLQFIQLTIVIHFTEIVRKAFWIISPSKK